MHRPQSILTFERCYLGAWLIGMVNSILGWPALMATVEATPGAAELGSSFAGIVMIGSLIIGAAITLVLWYFVARRGAVVAKWIVTAFFAITLLSFLRGLATGVTVAGLTAVVGVVTLVLQGIAIAMLFRPDAKQWFGETPSGPRA